ncbi:EAL domain-containing protein [Clostridium transplantifaecale]|uniref:EAL domain-containing protein n=1 Tax=Clostridium transplantifaecale TaxID=2479838 RepID=UPI000F634045|nr:EAL domain-containing protein [Clostridium transplantifaecale]
MQKKIFPVIITFALILSSLFSLFCLHNLQGNAKVINYAGIVRGATQRLIKEELNHKPNDALIKKLDSILSELQSGKGEYGLIRMDSSDFQSLILRMQSDWQKMKEEIKDVRAGGSTEQLFEDSESYFDLADQAVLAAEQFSEKKEYLAEKSLLILNCSFILMIFLFYLFSSSQAKRRKALLEAEQENRRKEERLSRMTDSLLGPINDISELIYITDIENHELLFLNKAGRESFHIDTMEGQKCYKALQGNDAPCDFCTTPLLKEGEIYTWEFTNPLTKRHYILKDSLIEWEGRIARMELAFDTTESEKEKIQLKSNLEADKMITECVRMLYQPDDIDAAISQVLQYLGSFLSAARTYIVYIRDGRMYNDYEWCADGIAPQKEFLQETPVELIVRWIPYFNQKKCIIIEDLEQIQKTAPKEYEILHSQMITSLVVAPLEHEGTLIGYFGVDNPPTDRIQNIAPLLQTLCYFLLLAKSHSDSQKLLKHLSYFDKLTDFYNRNKYIEDTTALTHTDKPVGIVYLDVNGLKDINDRYGHEFGDKVLVECARRMKSIFTCGNFYRIGGDEFVIICPDMKQEQFHNLVHELKARFDLDSDCQAAIGSQWLECIDDIGREIAIADARMYEDKKAYYRKNPASRRYRHYNDELLSHLSSSSTLQEEIGQNHFVVHLQPKISASSRLAEGAEALVRYVPIPGKLVEPGDFIPLLEEFEIINLIDFYVFRFVCSKLSSWKKSGRRLFPISVNFSVCSLKMPGFIEQLTDICVSCGISPEYLEIEVTEKIQNNNGLDVKELSSRLQKAGFTVALDDFGTECANVVLLSEVEFDVLKLDKSIIDHIADNPRNLAIVKSISEVCHNLNVCLIAEGVETEEQFSVLCSCGIDLVQGYLFSKPVSVEEYEKLFLYEK